MPEPTLSRHPGRLCKDLTRGPPALWKGGSALGRDTASTRCPKRVGGGGRPLLPQYSHSRSPYTFRILSHRPGSIRLLARPSRIRRNAFMFARRSGLGPHGSGGPRAAVPAPVTTGRSAASAGSGPWGGELSAPWASWSAAGLLAVGSRGGPSVPWAWAEPPGWGCGGLPGAG